VWINSLFAEFRQPLSDRKRFIASDIYVIEDTNGVVALYKSPEGGNTGQRRYSRSPWETLAAGNGVP
jgi:hypothetical protein